MKPSDSMKSRRSVLSFERCLPELLSGPGRVVPRGLLRSAAMGQVASFIGECSGSFRRSAMRRFLDGEFTDSVPLAVSNCHAQHVESLLAVLDVVETMAHAADVKESVESEDEPADESATSPDVLVAPSRVSVKNESVSRVRGSDRRRRGSAKKEIVR